ncbi:hypothetical protein ACFLRG_03625 [Bacteroidota bacterium]
MKRIALILFIIFLVNNASYCQGEIDNEGNLLFRNESSLAINMYSNGWGVDYRSGKWLDAFKKRIFSGAIIFTKDPKEYKDNPRSPHYSNFVFGKENSFFSIRGGYGFQREIFSKFDKGGIAIRYYYQGGPLIGFLKPIYYNRITGIDQTKNEYITEEQKFNKDNIHSPYDILNKASVFKGFNEIKLRMGLFLESGVSFEFGQSTQRMNAIEAGICVNVFHKRVQIMAVEKPNWFFLSLFVSYRFGKIKDARYK